MSTNALRRTPPPEIVLFAVIFVVWWSIPAIKWHIHREVVVPMTCYAYNAYDSIVNIVVNARFVTTMWLILVRQTIVVVISPPQIGNFAAA